VSADEDLSAPQFEEYMTASQVGRLASGDYGGIRMSDAYDDDYARWETDKATGYTDRRYWALVRDVSQNGFKEALEISPHDGGTVIDGHHRYFAALDTGTRWIPVSGRRAAAERLARYTPPGRDREPGR
jgi:hypothetical protein